MVRMPARLAAIKRPVQQLLGIDDRLRSTGQDPTSKLHGYIQHPVRRCQTLQQTDLLGPNRIDGIPHQKEFGQVPFADFGLQHIGDQRRQKSASCLRKTDLKVVGTDGHIASCHHASAPGVSSPMNGRNRHQR